MAENRSILDRAGDEPTEQWRFGDAPDQIADVYLPPTPDFRPPLMLIHGGFWRPEYDRTHLRPLASALAKRGHVVVIPEYQRTPHLPDRAISDVALAADQVAGRWGSAAIVVGHSAGGHLALCLAAKAGGARAVVALAPVADLLAAQDLDLDDGAVRDFLGDNAANRTDLDPMHLQPAASVTVVHGERDSIVPIELSEAYSRRWDVPFVRTATGHFELIDPEAEAWAELQTLLGNACG